MSVNRHSLLPATRIALAALLVATLAGSAAAQQLPARPADYVVDLAGVIDRGTFQKLNGYLKELEQKTTAQMIVLTVKTTGGEAIETYAVQAFERWKLGQKGKDNGVLLVVAVQDRRAKIEVGYGLEGVLPDAFCGRIGREVFAPFFKKGDYGRGVYEGTLVLANKVAADAGVTIGGMPARSLPSRQSARPSRGAPPEDVIYRSERLVGRLFFAVFMIVVVGVLSSLFGRGYHIYRNRRYTDGLWLWLLLGGMSSGQHGHRNWGGGGWGGGFGGGGFGGGGFGGGGGGHSGGGGASFGW